MNAPVSAPPSTAQPGWPMPLLAGIVAGAGLGVATQIGQGALPDDAAQLAANSGMAWLVVAFLVGAAMATHAAAAVAGSTTLVVASFAYYEAVDRFEGVGSDHRGALIWAAAGLVGGSVFAVAGHAARRSRHRGPALALLAGVAAAEAMHLLWWVGVDSLRGVGVVELALGAGLLVLALMSAPPRRWPIVVTVAAVAWAMTREAALLIDAAFLRV